MEQWAADIAVPGEQLGVRCLAQGSHRGHFLPELGFEPTTLGYLGFKSNALSIRPRLPTRLPTSHAKTTCLHATVISTVSVRVAVTSLPAPLAIKGSARRRETDRPVTDSGQSCDKSADSDHWPVNRCISSLL